MLPRDFYRICRIAASLGKTTEVTVIGSTAAIPWLELQEAEADFWPSVEVDISVEPDPDVVELVGEYSAFHSQYGVYAQPATPLTQFIAPADWRDQAGCFPFLGEDDQKIDLWVPTPEDLFCAKLARGEPRDWDFVGAHAQILGVSVDEVLGRLGAAVGAHPSYEPNLRKAMRLAPHKFV